jgi:hypothetical protein
MADFRKARRNLPAPPTADEAPSNLATPEVAPIDGRSLRATGRTKQLSTRVREEFHDELKMYAARHRLKLVEVLEQGHEALKKEKKGGR